MTDRLYQPPFDHGDTGVNRKGLAINRNKHQGRCPNKANIKQKQTGSRDIYGYLLWIHMSLNGQTFFAFPQMNPNDGFLNGSTMHIFPCLGILLLGQTLWVDDGG